jgi:pyridoxamine 5'-phosphate oxidase family protein
VDIDVFLLDRPSTRLIYDIFLMPRQDCFGTLEESEETALLAALRIDEPAMPCLELEDFMSVFSANEINYLNEQLLGRLSTVDPHGQPHVVPVGFRYNAETDTVDIGGHALDKTAKFRHLQANPHAAFVVDDLASTNPWRPRGIEIRGSAETYLDGGEVLGPGFGGAWIRILPERIVGWGLDDDPTFRSKRTVSRSAR